MVSASGIRWRPASVTKPLRSECAEKSPCTPALTTWAKDGGPKNLFDPDNGYRNAYKTIWGK